MTDYDGVGAKGVKNWLITAKIHIKIHLGQVFGKKLKACVMQAFIALFAFQIIGEDAGGTFYLSGTGT